MRGSDNRAVSLSGGTAIDRQMAQFHLLWKW